MMNAQNLSVPGPDSASVDESDQDVEVVYALPDQQIIVAVAWQPGLTLEQAVRRSGMLERITDYVLEQGRVGVFGLRQPLDYRLEPGDRVELYRPLVMSPNDARLRRADKSGR